MEALRIIPNLHSFESKLAAFPPVRCRLAAVHYPSGKRYGWAVPLSDEQIAEKGGIHVGEVRSISIMKNWDAVPVAKMWAFLRGCRLNLGNWSAYRRTLRLASREKFAYLRRSPLWKSQLEPILTVWRYLKTA